MGEFNLITKEVIFDSFQKVIKKKDKVVLLYSGLWSLINKLEFKKNIGKNFLNILEEIVGKKKTLVLPSFSGTSFIKNKVFNIRKSLDNKNGLLSKEALHRSYYYRTPQPIHSYLVFGDGKKEIDSLSKEDDNNVLKNAPHTLDMITANEWYFPYSREKAAFPLDYVRNNKFWPSVRRVDDAYGDRNLICSCAPIEDYMEA